MALNIKHVLHSRISALFLFTVLGHLRNHFILLLKQKVLVNRKNLFQCYDVQATHRITSFFLQNILEIAKLLCYEGLQAYQDNAKLESTVLSYSISTLRRYVGEIHSCKG